MSLATLAIRQIKPGVYLATRPDGAAACPYCGHTKFKTRGQHATKLVCRFCGQERRKDTPLEDLYITSETNGILLDAIESLWKERQ